MLESVFRDRNKVKVKKKNLEILFTFFVKVIKKEIPTLWVLITKCPKVFWILMSYPLLLFTKNDPRSFNSILLCFETQFSSFTRKHVSLGILCLAKWLQPFCYLIDGSRRRRLLTKLVWNYRAKYKVQEIICTELPNLSKKKKKKKE